VGAKVGCRRLRCAARHLESPRRLRRSFCVALDCPDSLQPCLCLPHTNQHSLFNTTPHHPSRPQVTRMRPGDRVVPLEHGQGTWRSHGVFHVSLAGSAACVGGCHCSPAAVCSTPPPPPPPPSPGLLPFAANRNLLASPHHPPIRPCRSCTGIRSQKTCPSPQQPQWLSSKRVAEGAGGWVRAWRCAMCRVRLDSSKG
jgi:hypothetical protein